MKIISVIREKIAAYRLSRVERQFKVMRMRIDAAMKRISEQTPYRELIAAEMNRQRQS